MSAGFRFSILFKNDSGAAGTAVLYQPLPDTEVLVWLSKYAYPGTTVSFEWQVEYGFVWSESGRLGPGVVVAASQYQPADLQENNLISLAYDGKHDAFHFEDQTSGGPSGSLSIRAEGSVPFDTAAVGIGIAGAATAVVPAKPNLITTFSPRPHFWIAFGSFIQGEVLDLKTLANPAQVTFQPSMYSMTAILNKDGKWAIRPTVRVNEELLRAREAGVAARWAEA